MYLKDNGNLHLLVGGGGGGGGGRDGFMYLKSPMIKAKIRWCSCRVENILTLGKLQTLHLS